MINGKRMQKRDEWEVGTCRDKVGGGFPSYKENGSSPGLLFSTTETPLADGMMIYESYTVKNEG